MPRYYRCRGSTLCAGSQVSAKRIEARVVQRLLRRTGHLPDEERMVLRAVARNWEGLRHDSRQRVHSRLNPEVRWNGPTNRLGVMLDEVAIADA